VHVFPIPRVGGIAIALAYAAALVSFSDPGSSLPAYDSPSWKLIPGAAIIFLTGLIDDFFNLRPIWKLLGQVAAAGIVFYEGLRIDAVSRVPLPNWLSLLVTVLWLLLCSNAFNLIDGLDGLCTGTGLVATLALFAAAVIQDNAALAHATLPLAGALLGFLCYNFSPATVFLGDSGRFTDRFPAGLLRDDLDGENRDTPQRDRAPSGALGSIVRSHPLGLTALSAPPANLFGGPWAHSSSPARARPVSPRRGSLHVSGRPGGGRFCSAAQPAHVESFPGNSDCGLRSYRVGGHLAIAVR
jgi:hypothetical protein